MCPNAGSSDTQTKLWSSKYGQPIAERLNAQAPGANLTAEDISNLISLCAIETVAKRTLSLFCYIFTPVEFAQFEYWADLDKYYGTGYLFFFSFLLIYYNFPSIFIQIRATPWSSPRCRLR